MASRRKRGAATESKETTKEEVKNEPHVEDVEPESEGKAENEQRLGVSFVRPLFAEAVIGYIFWSVVHSFGAMIWFFPLQVLEISGYEAFGIIWPIAPLLCGIGPLFRFLQTKPGLTILRLGLVASLASFQTTSTVNRLLLLAFGNFCAVLLLCASWFNKAAYQRSVSFWGFMLGFMALLSSRIWYVSLTPAWTDHTSNIVILALGVIAVFDRFIAYQYLWPETKSTTDKTPKWHLCAFGFGSLMFLTHFLFGEVSVPCRWVVFGYPSPGPKPNPWGAAILIELTTGFLLSSKKHLPENYMWWWFVCCHSAIGLMYLTSYFGLSCAIFLALYVASIWPEMSDRFSSSPVARTASLAFLTYLCEQLLCVWVTAYNFVPGGELTRERTFMLMVMVVLFIGFAMGRGDSKDHDDPSTTHIAYTNIDGSGPYTVYADFKVLLSLITIVGLLGFAVRMAPERHIRPPVKDDPKVFSSMIWSVRFMYDNDGWPSFEKAATILNDTEADVISFLESDASKPFLGNNDITMWMSEKLQMYSDFGPSTRSHTWGNNLMSKYPIVVSTHHLMPSPHGELGPALHAVLNISGTLVDFVTSHNGNDGDDLDRKLQTQYLANITRNSTRPLVFMGYVTSKPGSRDYRVLTSWGKLKDIDSEDKKRFCLYIMYRKLIRVGYARISRSRITDTEIQMAKFRIPDDPDNYEDNDIKTIKVEDVDSSLHFPSEFGEYYPTHWYPESHHYHMATPKYFIKETGQNREN
ncbi:PGAP2-interacting protein-like [Ptychodera flava]|uniref:PGAP2-interacting protein-like n=1 Tax=Ptychodera flava TaxID=63121 RepID=UPI00396A7220